MDFSRELFDEGLMATGIAFPTVPEGKARIRTIMTSEHTRAQLDQALGILTTQPRKRMQILVAQRCNALPNPPHTETIQFHVVTDASGMSSANAWAAIIRSNGSLVLHPGDDLTARSGVYVNRRWAATHSLRSSVSVDEQLASRKRASATRQFA